MVVCAAESGLVHVTVSPTLILITLGEKQFGSHPGVDDPRTFSITFPVIVGGVGGVVVVGGVY